MLRLSRAARATRRLNQTVVLLPVFRRHFPNLALNELVDNSETSQLLIGGNGLVKLPTSVLVNDLATKPLIDTGRSARQLGRNRGFLTVPPIVIARTYGVYYTGSRQA